jgi:hypothetical protein
MVEDIQKSLETEISVSINSVVNNHKYSVLDKKSVKKIIKKCLKRIINTKTDVEEK